MTNQAENSPNIGETTDPAFYAQAQAVCDRYNRTTEAKS